LSIAGIIASDFLVRSVLAASGISGTLIFAGLIALVIFGAHILAIGPIDYLLFRPLRGLKGIRKLFAYSFTGKSARYIAPGFRPLH